MEKFFPNCMPDKPLEIRTPRKNRTYPERMMDSRDYNQLASLGPKSSEGELSEEERKKKEFLSIFPNGHDASEYLETERIKEQVDEILKELDPKISTLVHLLVKLLESQNKKP